MRIITVLGFFVGMSMWALSVMAAEPTDNSLTENWYVLLPWAQQPPVDIYRKVANLQSAIGGLQNSMNAYTRAVKTQASAHNQRVLMQAELSRVEAAQAKQEPRRSNFSTRGTPAEIDAANRSIGIRPNGHALKHNMNHAGLAYSELDAYSLGVDIASMVQANNGWGNALQRKLIRGRK